MATSSSLESTSGDPFSVDRLRPSGSLLAAQLALGAAIGRRALDCIDVDPTVVDLLVRLEIAPDHELRAVEICRQLLLLPSHISRVIDRAEKAGLVERRADPGDRRASLVVPTVAGRSLAAEYLPRL
jgi:DNA-binding MarR family transcriptional regulator